MLGFGFALFLMLVLLAVIYSQFAMQRQPNPAEKMTKPQSASETGKQSAPAPLPATVTADTAVDDLIDEAIADRDDLSGLEEDEMADIEEGN